MSEAYWTVSSGVSARVGYSCRECRKVINKGEAIKVREGRKMRFYYHDKCFSGESHVTTPPCLYFASVQAKHYCLTGEADPRTQGNSSFNKKELPISDAAPASKGHGKWSVSSYGYRTTL